MPNSSRNHARNRIWEGNFSKNCLYIAYVSSMVVYRYAHLLLYAHMHVHTSPCTAVCLLYMHMCIQVELLFLRHVHTSPLYIYMSFVCTHACAYKSFVHLCIMCIQKTYRCTKDLYAHAKEIIALLVCTCAYTKHILLYAHVHILDRVQLLLYAHMHVHTSPCTAVCLLYELLHVLTS
jgi:hypothetical protein